ncbi:MAG: exopolysaccharide biosynthesis polyprenyl glycosylphosphotransferase [Hyphomicrobium sp.]
MVGPVAGAEAQHLVRRGRYGLSRTAFAASVFILELASIVLVAVTTGITYHMAGYGVAGDIEQFTSIGVLAGLAYGLTFLLQDEYGVESLLEGRRSNGRLLLVWTLAFAALAVVGFLTKSTAIFSRAWLIIFYAAGLMAVIALNAGLHRSIGTLIERGLIRPRRLMLVGTGEEITKMEREIADGAAGVYVSARLVLPEDALDDGEIGDRLESALHNARMLGVEDVIISGAWYRGDFIEKAVAAFSLLPVVIHLGAGGLVGRFKHARVARFGRTTTLSLTREPIGPFQAATKRAFDIVLAGVALVLLSPLFLLVAALVTYDSAGPAFFRQRRRGYNLEEFRMWKFRTMTTLDDGDTMRQATQGDVRVTRLGRILRKYSIDELPQLLNVLAGEMSLVGPRPHAVAHDRFFEKRIAMYPRRLNVKPGITGWAQVNGFRGATETDDSMVQRLEHDLYYIDNWSLLFDVYIVVLTVVSRKSQRNAY